MKKGILLCGHGSRSVETLQEFEFFANTLNARLPEYEITFGFLELAKPDFSDAVNSLYIKGVRSIIAVQLFLFDGKHVGNDVPSQIKNIQQSYTDIDITILPAIGNNPLLLEMLLQSIFPYFKTDKKYSVLTVGVGSSIENANIQLQNISNILGKVLAIEDVHVAYMSKYAKPNFEEAIQNIVANSEDEIIVIPLLLFNGVYFKTIKTLSESYKTKRNKVITVLPCLALNERFISLIAKNIISINKKKLINLN